VGYPPAGGATEVVDDHDRPLAAKEHGMVRVRNETMARSYIDNSQATAEFFRDGWFYPGDIGYLEDDGCLVVLGRSNDVVNIGGVKFSPTVVEHAVRALDGIDEVCALAMPDDKGVNRMVLLLQAAAGADGTVLRPAIDAVLAEMEINNFIVE
jgi:acyl-CoA synthetase (AMP-forming)/AMP-acid ligase II